MRFAPLITVTLFTLATSTAALAGGLSRLSLQLDGGLGRPSEILSYPSLGLGDGTSLGARLGLAIGPAMRLTAGVGHERMWPGAPAVTVPEIRLVGRDPATITSALVGLEATTLLRRPLRGPQASMYFGVGGGQAWLNGGELRFDDMNGPSFVRGGMSGAAPTMGADLGVRFGTGLARLAVDLGWHGLFVRSQDHPLTVQALRAGITL